MNTILQVGTAITVLLLTIVLIIKGVQRKDFSVLGEIMACSYLVGAIVFDIISDYSNSVYIHMGIFIVLFSFLATHTVYLITGRFKQMSIALEMIQSLRDLQDKYLFIVNHAMIGIYTLNMRGKFEFVNKKMAEITEYSELELLQKTAFDLVPQENKELIREKFLARISGEIKEETYETTFITKSGKQVKVIVNAQRTSNGHPTITGSIQLVEG